ncbi:cation diffusion facilitator family transporter [Pseudonocardia lutea]|uniref:Cation diffusion facilitator family transporter n=1 Tax=Pseudonocardia lutea TaxID=2172015 RepID=A0ABW1IG15_9PSEU
MGTGHGHGHGHAVGDRRRLVAALLVTLACAVLGGVGALLTGSLALLADLGHLLTDAGALAAAVVASVLAAKPACHHRTFGLGRVEVLVAGLNAVALVAAVVWVAVEGVSRLFEPAEIPGLPLLVIGAAGLVGNVVSLVVLAGGDRDNMNLRGAMLHVLGDALGSVGVMVAAIVLVTTGWPYADTLASLLIAALILPRAIGLLREVWHVLLEGAPAGIDVAEVRSALLAVPGVTSVHDLHVWAINDRSPSMSAHLVVGDHEPNATGCGGSVLDRAGTTLRERFGLAHSTLQVERHAHVGHEDTCH